jgi:hypothetical protein
MVRLRELPRRNEYRFHDARCMRFIEDQIHTAATVTYARWVVYGLIAYFLCRVGVWVHPYAADPANWPHITAVSYKIFYAAGWLLLFIGGMLAFAFFITGGRVFDELE